MKPVSSPSRPDIATHSDPDTESISIIAPGEILSDPVSFNALSDVLQLLEKGFPEAGIALNDHRASVRIILPQLTATTGRRPRFPRNPPVSGLLQYPDHSYKWTSSRNGQGICLQLATASFQGVGCALYGLLQESLGYRFYHPRGTITPRHISWPLADTFVLEAEPRFEKKGFHLHTLHPAELAEQMLDPGHPGALADVREYLDWLARNGQNVFHFFLVRGVDRVRWIPHAQKTVEYAHARGILAGVQISLSMLQQQAFQAIRLLRPFPTYKRQIDQVLAWLFQVDWDFITVDRSLAEHLPDLSGLLPSTAAYLVRQASERYGTKVFITTHVIRSKREVESDPSDMGGTGGNQPDGKGPAPMDGTGILIHTVMCYSVTEPEAPVYGNRNQRFMLDRAKAESRLRETWYWPESSYWITFDSSVPLFLLPYLDARFSDMETMEETGINGHLTFSSGWEWGYWLTDWSLARWSWRFSVNGNAVENGPLCCLNDLFPDARLKELWKEALDLQDMFLKKRKLMRYMSALPPFAELLPPFNKPFQPVPDVSLQRQIKSCGDKGIHDLDNVIRELYEYADGIERIISALDEEIAGRLRNPDFADLLAFHCELSRGLQVTALRARHRGLTIGALIAALGNKPQVSATSRDLLSQAAAIREDALKLVLEQERIYRYPVEHLARRRKSLTAYGFGYLYPVSSLHFWKREEEQVARLRFDAFFMNIWNFGRIIGPGSLFR